MSVHAASRFGSVIAVGALLVVSACGAPNDETVLSPQAIPAQDIPAQAATTTTSDVTTTSDGAEPTELLAATTTIAAEVCVVRCPAAGTVLETAGISFDAQLELRAGPAADQGVVATLPPTGEVVATGDNRLLWFEVSAGGATGWASSRNLFGFDGTSDVTTQVVGKLGATPRASSMLELGRIVADARAVTFDNMTSTVVAVVAPTEGAMGTVTYDVLGLPDDSVFGERLRITARQISDDDLPATGIVRAIVYELSQVESTSICARSFGVDGGLCV